MNERINIVGKCAQYSLPFKSYPKYIHSWPTINAVLVNKETGNATTTASFVVDTGASISIINIRFQDFIENERLPVVDFLRVRYGAGAIKELPVYDIGIIINGVTFQINAAFDVECYYNLLGHYSFFQNLSYVVFDSVLNNTRLIKN